jgi:hypothetical protein
MSEPNLGRRAGELAGQAAQAAGPAIERARDIAVDLVDKAGPYLEMAAGYAAQGVAAAADRLDKATGGKYTNTISSVSAKIEGVLDRER